MKIVFNINKAARRDRSHLVKVATQVQGKTGQYSSHRWINPNKAMDILKDDLKRQGVKNTDELSFKDKKTGQVINEKELMNRMEKENFKGTLQEYAKQYKIVSGNKKTKTSQVKVETSQEKESDLDNKRKDFLDSLKNLDIDLSGLDKPTEEKQESKIEQVLAANAPILDDADFTNKPAQFTDVDKIEYVEEDNYVPGETFQNLKLTNFRGKDGERAIAIRQKAIDGADDYVKRLDQIYGDYMEDLKEKRKKAQLLVTGLKNLKKNDFIDIDIDAFTEDDASYTQNLIVSIVKRAERLQQDTDINFYSKKYSKEMTEVLKEEAEQDNKDLETFKTRVDYRYRPEQLNGTKRNKPMTFAQADQQKANPKYTMPDARRAGFATNCQSTVFVYEMRLRGYDLETLPNRKGTGCSRLSLNTNNAWINPSSGKNLTSKDGTILGKTPKNLLKIIKDTVKVGERYHFSFGWKGRGSSGHIVTVHKNKNGDIVFYDPQVNLFTIGDEDILQYLADINYKMRTSYLGTIDLKQRLLRVDNLIPDEEILASVSRPSEVPTEGLEEDLDGQGEQETTLPNNIDEETINKIDLLLEPLREEKKENGYGGKGDSQRQLAEKLVKDANDRLGIHLKSKTESEKKAELQTNMAAFYNALKAGNITISQAINNPQFKNCAYLFIMALMDEDMEGEIDNYLNQIL